VHKIYLTTRESGCGRRVQHSTFFILIQQLLFFIKDNNKQKRDLWGALKRLRVSHYDSVNYESGMIDVAVKITYEYC